LINSLNRRDQHFSGFEISLAILASYVGARLGEFHGEGWVNYLSIFLACGVAALAVSGPILGLRLRSDLRFAVVAPSVYLLIYFLVTKIAELV
jgi:hypothetical protein